MADDTNEELHRMVKGIVDDLEAAASGSLYYIDGNYVAIDDLDDWKAHRYKEKVDAFKKEHPKESYDPEVYGFDTYEEWLEDEVGTVEDIDEPDEVSLSDYIDKESLGDVRFEVNSNKEFLGGKMLFCFGGPNIWVADDEVRGYWGGSTVEMSLDSDASSALYDWLETQWDNVKEC